MNRRGVLLTLLVCIHNVKGEFFNPFEQPKLEEEKREHVGLFTNFQLKLKGTEQRNGGTVSMFEVKMKEDGPDKRESDQKDVPSESGSLE